MCYGKRLLSHCGFPDNTDYYFKILYPIDGGLATLLHSSRKYLFRKFRSSCVHEQVAKVDCECPLYLCENGDEVDFVFVPHRMHFFDCETEEVIVL